MNETKLAMGVRFGSFDKQIPMIKFYNDIDCEDELFSVCLSVSQLILMEEQIYQLKESMLDRIDNNEIGDDNE